MKYLTMICDIKNSKDIENREEVQYKLIDTLKDVNKSFSSIIVVPFIISV